MSHGNLVVQEPTETPESLKGVASQSSTFEGSCTPVLFYSYERALCQCRKHFHNALHTTAVVGLLFLGMLKVV